MLVSATLMPLPAPLISLLISLLLSLGASFRSKLLPSPHFVDQDVVIGSLGQIVHVFQRVIAIRDVGGHHHQNRQKPDPVLACRAKAFPISRNRHLKGRVWGSLKARRQTGQLRHPGTAVERGLQLRGGARFRRLVQHPLPRLPHRAWPGGR
jgi:hypothetical protein